MMATRSNKDVQGWHKGLQHCAAGKINKNLHLLINLIHQEARLTALHIGFVSKKKLTLGLQHKK